MIVELTLNGRIILRMNIWYLVLSAILRGSADVRTGENWKESELFLCKPVFMRDVFVEERHFIPQPAEFNGLPSKKG